jgi:hypothetical protein
LQRVEKLGLQYPPLSSKQLEELEKGKQALLNELNQES